MRLVFGALSPTLAEQLEQQGLASGLVEDFQQDARAITRLAVRGYIPTTQVERCRQRITKYLAKSTFLL